MIRSFVLRMAWRESRGARRRLGLLTGAVAAGVAALVAVNSFAANLRDSVSAQAQALLGADLSLGSRRPFSPRAETLLDSLIAGGSTASRVTSFNAMAFVPRSEGVRFVQVTAVEPGWPYYGTISTEPEGSWTALHEGGGVLLDPSLIAGLNARVGDTLALGDARLEIRGTVTSVPGNVAAASAFSPRVYISAGDLTATNLIRFGSRVDYEAFIKLADPTLSGVLAKDYRPKFRPERVGIQSVEDNRDDLRDTLTRMGNYLGLVALIALLLGGLGVASAVHVFIRQKLDTIAVLRCLGATTREIFVVYLVQALAMGLLGSAIGAALGLAVQQVLPSLLQDLLPVDVRVRPSAGAVLLGMGLGLWVATLFALLPLLRIRKISPLVTLRRDYERTDQGRDWVRIAAAFILALSVAGLAVLQVRDLRDGLFFAGGIGAALLLLWLASLGLIRGVRRFFPSSWPYLWRQGLANLYRPANQTVTVVLSLGFGATLLATLFLVQHNLLRDLRFEGPGARPNLVFFDIQADQQQGVVDAIRSSGLEPSAPVPIIPMRIRSVKGKPVRYTPADTLEMDQVDSTRSDSTSIRGWAVRREYRSTWRDTWSAPRNCWRASGGTAPGRPRARWTSRSSWTSRASWA